LQITEKNDLTKYLRDECCNSESPKDQIYNFQEEIGMKFIKVLTIAGIATFAVSPVIAQTVGIGTTAKGATSQVSAAIAKVTSQFGGMQMRPTPMAGTQKYIPAVNDGSLEFGVANIMQTAWSIKGQVLSKGRPNPNIRLVSTLMKFRVGPLVGKKTKYKTVGDLKGSRAPTGFKAATQAKVAQMMPGADIRTVKPNPKIPGVEVPTNLFHFDYMLFAGKHVSNDVAYRVAKAMFENKKALVGASPMWKGFKPKGMSKAQGDLKYHPGAIKLFKEKGVWR
jgi:TRAP-type uncharacterized transport system substrate-binding protein